MNNGPEPMIPRISKRLRVCVGIQDDGMNGIETYAEQVAIAASLAGHDTTLIATTAEVANAVYGRIGDLRLRVIDAGLKPRTSAMIMADRLMPQLQIRRVGEAFARVLDADSTPYDVFHLNRPALAPWVQGQSGSLYVAGWFFPHAAAPRVVETWRHTGGSVARRVGLAAKSLSYYMGDQRGYRAATGVVACTELLASQLRSKGLPAVACPPPVRVSGAPTAQSKLDDGTLRLFICSADLAHPRKNLQHAVRAAGLLASPERRVVLRAVGRGAHALEAEAKLLPPYATFEALGPKKPEEVHAEMRRAHAFLLPSLYEEWGYVAIESILSGTPVVSYPVYPFADVITQGLGIVADAKTPASLAQAVEASLRLERGPALAAVGEKRFGALTLGRRLTQIWTSASRTAASERRVLERPVLGGA